MKSVLLLSILSVVSESLFAGMGCHGAGGCPQFIYYALGWFVVTSLLLFVFWNHVMTHLFKVKAAKIWHAFVFVALCAAFCLPCKMGGMRGGQGCCKDKMKAGEMMDPKQDNDGDANDSPKAP